MVTPPRSDPANRAYLDRYHADRSSIFVGTLPSSVTEDQLREIFESFGPIVEILIKITPSRYDPDESICFAFIEFRSWDSVTRILDSKVSSPEMSLVDERFLHVHSTTSQSMVSQSVSHRRVSFLLAAAVSRTILQPAFVPSLLSLPCQSLQWLLSRLLNTVSTAPAQ